jgi:hypothetical protein
METTVEEIKQQVFGIQPAPATEKPAETSASTETASTEGGSTSPETSDTTVNQDGAINQPAAITPDYSAYLKETFGVEKADDIKSQLARVQQLEAQAQTPAEYQFANEQAKLLANAINSGNFQPLKEYVDTQLMLSNTEGMTEEQKLKLKIKMENPLFSDALVQEEYDEVYGVDEDADERAKLKIQQKRMNDVNAAQQLFNDKKSKVVLPEIKAQTNEDPEYTAWKANQERQNADRTENETAYTKISPKDITNTFKFNDEANKLAFDVSYEPDAESFGEVLNTVMDDQKFLSMYANQDGSLDRAAFLKDIYNARNLDKIVNQAIVQAVNQTKAWYLKTQKNITDTGVRNFDTPEPTDVDRLRGQIFGK